MLLAYIPISAFSRWREYKADEGSAYITSPSNMANALLALGSYDGAKEKKNSFAMYKIESRQRVSIFATHPSIEARVKRLREMSTKIINRL
jgi:heat shock protein HtpX